jgi:AbrB family looped-hinge helix DNA binding protein
MVVRVSRKGQVTLPAAVRRKLKIMPNSQVEVIVGESEITIRPLKRVEDVAGSLSRYARPEGPGDWDAVRDEMERAVAGEVALAMKRRRGTDAAARHNRPASR